MVSTHFATATLMITLESPTYYSATKKYNLSFPTLETTSRLMWW